jgi:CBS domain-containing protein
MHPIEKTVGEIIKSGNPPQVSLDSSVATAVNSMRENHQSCVLVVEDGRLRGIFTERDYLNRVVAQGRQINTTLMVEVMTADPETLQISDRAVYAINKMAVGGFRNVPIVDGDGKPVALLNVPDVVEHLGDLFQGGPSTEALPAEWRDIGGG